MKRKHQGFVAVCVCLAAVASAVLYLLYGSWQHPLSMRPPRLPALSSVTVPDSATLAEIRSLERKMEILAQPPPVDKGSVRMALFGYTPESFHMNAGRPKETHTPAVMDYALTMAFEAERKKVCMINGELLGEGAVLADGAVLLKIESRRVLVEKDRVRKWIYLSDPKGRESEDKNEALTQNG